MQALSSRSGCSSRVQHTTRRVACAVVPAFRPRAVQTRVAVVAAAFAPPSVSETKKVFLDHYPRPIASIYNPVVQELLVQQHFMRYSVNYEYNAVFALGVVSVFDQILEQVEEEERNAIFSAYIKALGEDAGQYRNDATMLEEAAAALTGPPSTEGDSPVSQALSAVAAKSEDGSFGYNRFFAIGLFRLLEITGAKEPSALESLVKAVGVKPEAVNKDLTLYKVSIAWQSWASLLLGTRVSFWVACAVVSS